MVRRSLADQLADAIVSDVIGSELNEGDPLPSTGDLATRYGVSRTVVREALASLTGRGILINSQGRESVVALPGAADLSRLLKFRVDRESVALSDVVQVRLAVEVIAAELAADQVDDAGAAELLALVDALGRSTNDEDYHLSDLALHRAIAVASGNALIVLTLDSLTELLLDFRITATSHRRARGQSIEVVVDQHRRIVERIAAGDPRGAGSAMREHLETAASDAQDHDPVQGG